ncbi:MAG: BON domain-containing protein [Thermoanaerobaculia bacterium]|nr:BON domain-containing protein [Thermoanaerobaculia bacterium]
MKSKFVVVLAMMLTVAAFACRTASTATPDEIDPTVIEASIRSQIAAEYPDETFGIGIDVDDAGVVTLSGSVDTEEQRVRIPQLVQKVSGVTKIITRLTVE